MKNEKIKNFFKTIFFRGNNSYILLILYFWFSIAYLVIMFLAYYYPFYDSILEKIYDIRNFAYVITFLLSWPISWPTTMFISQDFLEKVKIVECGGICLPNPFFLLIASFIVVFITDLFIVLVVKLFRKK